MTLKSNPKIFGKIKIFSDFVKITRKRSSKYFPLKKAEMSPLLRYLLTNYVLTGSFDVRFMKSDVVYGKELLPQFSPTTLE